MIAFSRRFTRGTSLAICLLPCLLSTWGRSEARADLILTLSSSDDLSNFAVGDTATFRCRSRG